MKLRLKVLVLTDWFSPGFKAGGPIQSVKNLVAHLGDDIDFSIVTGESDLGDINRYKVKEFDSWISDKNHRVCYTTSVNRLKIIRKELSNEDYRCIYLNSFFSSNFTLIPLIESCKRGILNKIVLAPRGMLGNGALRLKPLKKNLFLLVFKILGFHKLIRFHSTDISETLDIFSVLGEKINLSEVSNLQASLRPRKSIEITSPVRFVFASRISPKKNLDFAIKALNATDKTVVLDIYGVVDDQAYWKKCKSLAKSNIELKYHGCLDHDSLMNELAASHYFILPTLNENFGHAIIEALSIGLPILISDQTPWSEIDNYGGGKVIPIDDSKKWTEVILSCIDLNNQEYDLMCEKSVDFVHQKINIDEVHNKYKLLFGARN